ncbi:undecaprenyldiphospho-muramoylpentapeptide beta-N-acetylglucosaminyltransferase [Devosia nitrariae]|uniref:UDP-N-acetylglucosamine--N-acetylmuramyl-(pentapeptide) pyrophosphoryl-undecaprenol N-acetylglucosamine transferase n=1 Tax=Devosia nitrariae TaxID=2071872 RepID=A0ABQ5W085_9HYPH|nr:undecaprenyldiphospho-muramoylpentapeptide beta-N-acetylglucosaminyltransferase [Devosia nitrariae]GLQ53484.1 UDP-N-acetylglucosamine--N-acetylmuramyl-(pentapeptide) pyrophosphoryl-undecaprenol N-acetylglucosamine transferase [Devosia nitrariae]
MKTFVLMAGGTGGHLFPAMALAQELRRRGHVVDLMTDHRVASYGQDFPARKTYVVPAATPSIRNPFKFIGAGFTILYGIAVCASQLRSIKPDAVVGFGGYPTFPPMVAARLVGIPGILHEANAVLGRANKALIRFAQVLATGFPSVKFTEDLTIERVVTGNPVRDRVRALAGTPYPSLSPNEPVRILIYGGSQGARIFADLVPPAIAGLPESLRHRLVITQQCRPEDLDRVAEAYRRSRVNVELTPFIADLPERLAGAHLVISRAGALTIADLAVVGRPAILVPLPGSLDADQKTNATVVEAAGGGWIAEQATLSPQSLGTRLATLLSDPQTLARAAAASLSLGQPLAVEKLADLAERLAGQGK